MTWENTDDSDHQGAENRFKLGVQPYGLAPVANEIKKTDVQYRGHANDDCHEGIERQFDKGIDNGISRNGKGRDSTEIGATDNGGQCRGYHQGRER